MRWWRMLFVMALATLLSNLILGTSLGFSHEVGQQCKPRAISGTGSGSAYFVVIDDIVRSHHNRENTAVSAAGDSLELSPFAAIEVKSLFDILWRRGSTDCSPESPDPDPAPDPGPVPLPAPDPEPSQEPIAPRTVSIMGYTSDSEGHWGSQLNWSPDAVADSFRVYGGKKAGGGEWRFMLPGTATTLQVQESYTEVTPIYGCVVSRMNDGREAEQQCDGMDLAPMPPGSWGSP